MSTWVGFLVVDTTTDAGRDAAFEGDVPGAAHDIVLAGQSKALRVVELDDGAGHEEPGTVVMRCVLNRHHLD
ncbi:MAG TPA: hypothetical protein VGO92_03705 [Acidimicrobiales bacterium]|jgi:hypothetical protein|nr:hypothetical protein [Acidimicrobiales bacterium]